MFALKKNVHLIKRLDLIVGALVLSGLFSQFIIQCLNIYDYYEFTI